MTIFSNQRAKYVLRGTPTVIKLIFIAIFQLFDCIINKKIISAYFWHKQNIIRYHDVTIEFSCSVLNFWGHCGYADITIKCQTTSVTKFLGIQQDSHLPSASCIGWPFPEDHSTDIGKYNIHFKDNILTRCVKLTMSIFIVELKN